MPYVPPPELLIETDGPVTIVTMNNPEMRNAFVDPLHDAMREVWRHLAEDSTCRVAVLTGPGARSAPVGTSPGSFATTRIPNTDAGRSATRGS